MLALSVETKRNETKRNKTKASETMECMSPNQLATMMSEKITFSIDPFPIFVRTVTDADRFSDRYHKE